MAIKLFLLHNDNTVRVWNKHTGEHRGTCPHEQRISALYTYGTKIFTTTGNTLLIWDRDTQELLHTCTGQNRDAKVLCANDQYVFSGAEDELIRCWNSILPVSLDLFLKDIVARSPLSPFLEIIS